MKDYCFCGGKCPCASRQRGAVITPLSLPMFRTARSARRLVTQQLRSYRNPVELDGWNTARCSVPLGGNVPKTQVDAWVAPNATLVGDVTVHDRASVWYGAVLRGDLAPVVLGAFSSVGDRSVLSTSRCVLAHTLCGGDVCTTRRRACTTRTGSLHA